MQLEIERTHLVPQPIELLRELVGRHVVLRAPHGAGVGKSQLARALVGELDETSVVLLHDRRDGVPAFPHLAELLFVSRRRHDLRDLVDVEAGRRLRLVAPLAFAVGRLQPRHDRRQLFGFLRIGRRGHDERELEEVELAALVGRNLDFVEPGRLLGEARNGARHLQIHSRADRLGVVGDEGLRDPPRLILRDVQALQRLVRVVEELLRVCGRGCRGRGGGCGAAHAADDRGTDDNPADDTPAHLFSSWRPPAIGRQRPESRRFRTIIRSERAGKKPSSEQPSRHGRDEVILRRSARSAPVARSRRRVAFAPPVASIDCSLVL